MTRLRFARARDVFAAFPTAAEDVGVDPGEAPSLAFLQALIEARAWNAAVSFCAYLLPRREAVWWGCQSLRHILPVDAAAAAALETAETWVRQPEEARRRDALDHGTRADPRAPASWMALAAAWSGGSITPPQYRHGPPEIHQTARAVRTGLMIAMSRVSNDDMPAIMEGCLREGVALMREAA